MFRFLKNTYQCVDRVQDKCAHECAKSTKGHSHSLVPPGAFRHTTSSLRKDLGRIYCPYRRHLIFPGKNPSNLLSHPMVTPLMPVTTYYHHPRSPPHPNAIDEIEGPLSQDGLPSAIGEGDDRDALMGGSQADSSDEGEESDYNVVACVRAS